MMAVPHAASHRVTAERLLACISRSPDRALQQIFKTSVVQAGQIKFTLMRLSSRDACNLCYCRPFG